MKKGSIVAFVLAFLLLASCEVQRRAALSASSPKEQFPVLFHDVQTGRVFPDSKTFVDCQPKTRPGEIEKAYLKQKDRPGFNLTEFVMEHFYLPPSSSQIYKSNAEGDVEAHINTLWEVLKRNPDSSLRYSSLIALPNSYIVPGGRFREIYYWDSYFTMLGLEESGRVDIIENMVNNFAFLINKVGFIPNGNRTYYLTRSQPPFFSLMVELLMHNKGAKGDSVLLANRVVLEKEYAFWMKDAGDKGASKHVVHLPDDAVLNRYHDAGDWPREESYPEDIETAHKSGRDSKVVYRELRSGAESGWDFSSRWFNHPDSLSTIKVTELVPVDLNCLLYKLEMMLSQAYLKEGNQQNAQRLSEAAASRKRAILRYCWDAEDGWFTDYNWKEGKLSKFNTLAGVYPLYFGISTPGQADSVAVYLKQHFLKPGGLVTTLFTTGQQWDAPNGWAPLQWIAVEGLNNYQKKELAKDIAQRWSTLNKNVFKRTGKLLEKYNVVDTTLIAGGGEYPTQDGFGWTNGVLLKMIKKYGK